MAYIKTGTINEMSKKKKTAISIAVIAVVAVAALIAAFKINSRDMTQIFLSDKKYAEYVVAKNAESAYSSLETTIKLLTEEGTISAKGSIDVEPSDSFAEAYSSTNTLTVVKYYINSLEFNTDLKISDGSYELLYNITDDDGELYAKDTLMTSNGTYVSYLSYGTGWQKESSTDTSEGAVSYSKLKKALTSSDSSAKKAVLSAVKEAYDSVSDDLQFSETANLSSTNEEKTATGDRVNITFEKEDVTAFINALVSECTDGNDVYKAVNSCLDEADQFKDKDEFDSYIEALGTALVSKVESRNISVISMDLIVNKENQITSANVLIKEDSKSIVLNSVLQDDNDAGMAFSYRNGDGTSVKIRVDKTSDDEGKIIITNSGEERTVNYSGFSFEDGIVYGKFKLDPYISLENYELGTIGCQIQIKKATSGAEVEAEIGCTCLGTIELEAEVEKGELDSITDEKDIEITELTADELSAARTAYFTQEAPEKHSGYSTAVQRIVSAVLSSLLKQALSA